MAVCLIIFAIIEIFFLQQVSRPSRPSETLAFVHPSGWTFNLTQRPAEVSVCSTDMLFYLICFNYLKENNAPWKLYNFFHSIPNVIIDCANKTNLNWVSTSLKYYALFYLCIKQSLVRLVLALCSSLRRREKPSAVWQPAVLGLLFSRKKNSWKSSLNQPVFLPGTSCHPQTSCLAYAGPVGALIDMINLNSLLSGCWILIKQACFKSSWLTLRSCD